MIKHFVLLLKLEFILYGHYSAEAYYEGFFFLSKEFEQTWRLDKVLERV